MPVPALSASAHDSLKCHRGDPVEVGFRDWALEHRAAAAAATTTEELAQKVRLLLLGGPACAHRQCPAHTPSLKDLQPRCVLAPPDPNRPIVQGPDAGVSQQPQRRTPSTPAPTWSCTLKEVARHKRGILDTWPTCCDECQTS